MSEQLGDAALLFDPESVDEIASNLERLWVDDGLCAQLVEKGREHARNWGQKEFNLRFREIIDQVAEGNE